MAHNIPFPPRQPSASTHLPLTLISLEDWALVTLNGPDTVKYLGAVTADIDALAADRHVLCAHCDAKGKMWSNLRLFHRGEGFAYLERRSVLDSQLAEIKNTRCSPKSPSPPITMRCCWASPVSRAPRWRAGSPRCRMPNTRWCRTARPRFCTSVRRRNVFCW